MTYELAKQLKDAGFPFNFGNTEILDSMPPFYSFDKYPTLEELIEACGDDLSSVGRYLEDDCAWRADMSEDAFARWEKQLEERHIDTKEVAFYGCGIQECCGYETGSTPAEAVARLWLALNKHD